MDNFKYYDSVEAIEIYGYFYKKIPAMNNFCKRY